MEQREIKMTFSDEELKTIMRAMTMSMLVSFEERRKQVAIYNRLDWIVTHDDDGKLIENVTVKTKEKKTKE